jgi:methylmalonyl-CoA/ethylmalonyl-CoA epimerase
MSGPIGIDHVTLCVQNLAAAEFLFTKILGFDVLWCARDVGTEKSSMDTIVVQRGPIRVAIMQGHDKTIKSQINEFVEHFGSGVQHIALEVDDIDSVCREWETHGVKFTGPTKEGRDGFGPLRQRFTYPLFPGSGVFLELIQRQVGDEKSKSFAKGSVESLYKDIERDQESGVHQTIIDFEAQMPREELKKAS